MTADVVNIDIVLEQDNANDVSAIVVRVKRRSGEHVLRDEHLFDIETSKAVQEVVSPADGIVVHQLLEGQTVAFGERIAGIVTGAAAASIEGVPAAASAGHAERRVAAATPPRLSRGARELASRHGLTAAMFDAAFVTTADVQRYLDQGGRVGGLSAPNDLASAEHGERIAPHKSTEHLRLSRGAGGTMLSVVGGDVAGGPFVRPGAGFFENRLVDLVVYEASRLMRTFPKLNASFEQQAIKYHSKVVAGVAFDGGGRLVVYGVEQADTLPLPELQAHILAGFKRYVRNQLRADELTNATFTVTDLGATGASFVFPLLPVAQSAIIAIAASTTGACRLFLGFDHRITEGLEAATFLRQLCGAVSTAIAPYVSAPELQCADCGARPDDPQSGVDVLAPLLGARGERLLCCPRCFARRLGRSGAGS